MFQSLIEHTDAWPFKEPVDSRDVPDYYDIIKDPIGELTDLWLYIPVIQMSTFQNIYSMLV